jgi:hypothetical protein
MKHKFSNFGVVVNQSVFQSRREYYFSKCTRLLVKFLALALQLTVVGLDPV